MFAPALAALVALAAQAAETTTVEQELARLIEPELSVDELARADRTHALDVVAKADFLPRLQSFERRHGVPAVASPGWQDVADRLAALMAALRCPPEWLPDKDPLGRETLLTRATLFAALGQDEQADADLDRVAELGASNGFLGEAQLGLLRAARAERQGDARLAWDQRVIAAASAGTANRADLRDAALVQLALSLAQERHADDARVLLAAVAQNSASRGLGRDMLRHLENRSKSVPNSPPWVREWAAHELATLDTDVAGKGDQLVWLDVYSVLALRILPHDEDARPRLLAVVHIDATLHSTVLRPDRDDLGPVSEWLKPELRRTPANWDAAVALLASLPDPGRGLPGLLAGVRLLAPSSIEGLADADRELRNWLGDGPELGKIPVLTAQHFVAAWEPWLAARGLLPR